MRLKVQLKTFSMVVAVLLGICLAAPVTFAAEKPNILVIWGDDIGYWNPSYINHGMMGYKTPNIDRIASEGLHFTDYYGEQSCTGGRSTSIT
jgi:arylsulfatase A-like enzyme